MKELILKHKDKILYLVFGFLTFIVSVISFWVFYEFYNISELISNIISWIMAVTFAFLTNRVMVFKAKVKTAKEYIMQVIKFYFGRLFTLIIEEVILYIFISRMKIDAMFVKVTAQVVVIVLNYIISRYFVFVKKEIK